MIMVGIKKIWIVCSLLFVTTASFAQITSGRIVYERKTNLQKLYGDNERVKRFLKPDMKWKIEEFELYFNDSLSAFLPIESDEPEQGFMKFLTTHNKVYNNLATDEKVAILNMWGTETYVKDSITKRTWKVTESKRKIAGFVCRKAMWEMNDSTRIYAWFSSEVVPTVGPEGFNGLPGTILGLATENGSIIYFAKEVKAIEPPKNKLEYNLKGKDVYTVEELKATLLEKMGQWVKKEDLDAMFSWL